MAGGQVSIEESVRRMHMPHCADDARQRAFDDAMVVMGETPIDLVSGDEDSPDAPCDEAPCDEKVPELKRMDAFCHWMDAPLASMGIIVQPKKRARASKALKRNLKAQAKGSAKSKAANRELKDAEV